MRKQRLDTYLWLGTTVLYLEGAQPSYEVHGEPYVISNIRRLLNYCVELDLPVTQNAVWRLYSFGQKLKELPGDAVLTREQALELREIMSSLRQTLGAELAGIQAFMLTPKKPDVQRLMDEVPGLFAPKVFEALPEIAQYDFSEAGKCIALERPTAAAFHLLRGTEAVLRDYYKRMVRQKRIKSQLWHPLVEDLRLRRTGIKYEALYNNLDNIRKHYRNPTQHPEKTYDIDEAQDLWSICVAVVNQMTRVLRDEGK